MRKFYNRALGFLLVFAGILTTSGTLLAQVSAIPIQMPECTSVVPGYQIDLSAYPDMEFTTPEVLRQAGCCGDNDRYLAFYVTLNPNVAAIEVVVAPGYADPSGSGNYQIVTGGDLVTPGTCGPQIDAGTPLCITGAGPHKILYSKPGGNLVKYIFRQIPKPTYPASQPTRVGCTLPLPIYGLNNINITATAKSANCVASLATCNTFLSCLNCDNPVFSGGANNHPTLPDYPYSITYTVTGNQQASTLCGTYAQTGTFTVTVYDALTVQVTPNPAAFCSGSAGINLTATASGGLAPYTYIWKDSQGNIISPNNAYFADSAGLYTAIVTDQLITATCAGESETINVTEGILPIVNAGSDTTVCASSPVAILNGTSTTGSGVWSGGAGTFSPNANSLLATYTPTAGEISSGSVTLTLTSSQIDPGCSNSTDQVTINFSPLINAVPTAGTIACYNGTTTINAGQSGGLSPYTYFWSNGTTGTSISAGAGTYSLTVTDAIGCSDNTPITITQPSPLGINLTSTLDNGICDGTAAAIVTGGTGTYDYLWSPGGATTASISGLCAGDYTVTVTDDNLCSITQSVVVNNDPTCQSLNVTIPTHTDVDCFNGTNGTATTNVVGGTPAYTYSWSPGGSTSPNPTGLASGTYTVMVTDFNGCKDYAAVSILQPTAITNSMTHTDVTSIGGTDGTATANPQGGTPGYSYSWSTTPTQTTQTATGLVSAPITGVMYYVDITDSKFCTIEDSVLINEPPCNDFILAVNTTNATCSDYTNGSAYILIANGSGNYTISWSNGATNVTSVTGLGAGTYTVTVTDNSSNCTTFQSFSITEPNPLSLGLVPTNISCFGDQNGTIDLTVSGGTNPFSFVWVQGGKVIANHEDLIGQGPGTYTVTVTDANSCTATASIGITQPSALTTTYTFQDNPCFGNSLGSIDATPGGGTTPYTYAWTGTGSYSASTQDISGLPTGGYLLTLTDNNGCVLKTNVNISQPELLTASAIMTQEVTCAAGNDGDADLTVAGGTTPYSYAWTGPSYTGSSQDLLNVAAGTYNVTVTDAHSCTATASVTITTVLDVTDPVITCPGNQSVTTTSGCVYTHSGTSWNATATDNCLVSSVAYVLTGATTGSGTNLNGVPFNLGITTVTWTATDGLGNTDVCSYTVTVADVTAPTSLTCSTIGNQTVPANAGVCTYTHSGTAWNVTASDNCSIASVTYLLSGATTTTIPASSLNGQVFNLGTTTVTWTATDGSGNTTTCSYTVTVTDTQAPTTLTCSTVGNQTVPANVGVCTYTHSGTAWNVTASDNCSIASVTYLLSGATTTTIPASSLNGQVFNLGLTTVTWTATDGSGNTTSCSYTVTVTDTQAPTGLTCSTVGNQTVPSNAGVCTYTHTGTGWNVTASDNCSIASVTYLLSGATTTTIPASTLSGQVFNLGTTTVTWTATDGSGNTTSCSYTVTVTDTQAPTALTCSTVGNQTVPANAGVCTYTHSGTAWNVTASDNCSIASVTYLLSGATTTTIPASSLNGQLFNLGTTTVTWTATDGSGNTTTCSYTVTVTDTQAPTALTCSTVGNQTVVANIGVCTYTHSGTAWNVTASDNCSIASVTYLLSGATTTTIPSSTLDGQVFNLGTTTVTWTATDGSGNTTSCFYTVTVTDTQIPSILSCGVTTSITVNANAGICTYTHQGTLWNASGSDNCSTVTMSYVLTGATTGSGTSLAGQTFNLGTTNVTWTATDGSGNTETCSFDVIVVDNQLPTILTCGPNLDQNVFADASQCNYTQTGTTWDATATDNCSIASLIYTLSGATTGTGTSLQNVDFNLGITTVTWTATDGSGNVRTCSFNVTVRDNQFPAITTCGDNDQTVSANTGVCTYTQTSDAWNAIATDNCTVSSLVYTLSGATTGTGTTLNGVVFNLGTTTVLWTATDNSGNATTCNYTITVIDDQDPGIANCPSDITVGVDAGDCGAVVNWTVPTFSDNCGFTFTASHDPGDFFNVGTTAVTYTVTDGSGNVSICTFDVTVDDDELPTISCAANIASCDPFVSYSAPVVGDNCGVATVVQTAGLPSGMNYPVGTTTNVYQVTDIHGNMSTCSFTVTIHPLPVATTTDVDVTCNGNADGTINLTVTGGTAPFTYNWDNGASSEDLSGLAPGTYTVQVSDNFGCTATAFAAITEPAVLTLTAEDDHVNCYNGNDGAIDLTIAGGTTPYTYDWSNNATTQDITGLTDGSYDVTVTDFNGCTVTYSTVIDEPDTLVIQTAIYDATCNAPNGSIQTLITGGTTPYLTSWSNGSNTANLNNVSAGTYTLTVIDGQGCTALFTGSVASVSNLSASSIVRDARCYGQANGEIQVIMESGNEPYVFDWSNGASTPLNDNLAAGSYMVTVTDAFGCEVSMNFDVNQPDSLEVTLTTSVFIAGTNVSLNGASDGWITTDVIGGTPAYSYEWSNGETTEDIYNLPAGAYSVVVIDQNGCKASAAVRFTEPLPLEMPEGFSPNGDGTNDGFVIHGIEAYPNNDLVIFNRWGNVVYEVSGYQNEWFGENTAGEPLPDGTYFAILKVYASEDRVITLKGYVDLRR